MKIPSLRTSTGRLGPFRLGALAAVGLIACACASAGSGAVSSEEIPALEAKLQSEPDNGGTLLRYAAALQAAGNCDSAIVVAQRGSALRPRDALGPLVIGTCNESAGNYAQALAVYDAFLRVNDDGRGVGSVRARQLFAMRSLATEQATQAIADEQQLPQPDLQTVAVLPLAIVGDSSYQPLSRGLAQMITSDLALLQRFRMVERLRLGAVLDELNLAQTQDVQPQTAARLGRLVQAGQMVQGLASIPPDESVRLEASVVRSSSEVVGPQSVNGRFRDLMDLEKELVVAIASAELGYQLSDAELNLIRNNGTKNLTAFLAYSLGLVAEDRGQYGLAASYYQQAAQADPSFSQAREGYQAATSANETQSGGVTNVVALSAMPTPQPDAFGADPSISALQGAIGDIASTYAEQKTSSVSESPVQQVAREPSATSASVPTPNSAAAVAALSSLIRIVFVIP